MAEKPGWQHLREGDISKYGDVPEFKTGDWRSERPIFNEPNCIQCMLCWISCPDMAVYTKDGKVTGFDYDRCKGCGICDHECPTKPEKRAIVMKKESK